ncbi:hypothetical protein FOL47_000651 [Perkinsus chesapeaki]|uniref:Uncharacterized protein n=1 Tax=Perkinsus chesapeaki TaxID=330153 RepID=A0A7J6MLA5_PERCH|nr:hypothetical protein FOL47_000651 [Perkinsus chesapeaki]
MILIVLPSLLVVFIALDILDRVDYISNDYIINDNNPFYIEIPDYRDYYNQQEEEEEVSDDYEVPRRRLNFFENIWNKIWKETTKQGGKAFKRTVYSLPYVKYARLYGGFTIDTKDKKIYFKSLSWIFQRIDRAKQLKLRKMIDDSWLIGFFFKWPKFMTGFGSLLFIIFLCGVYKFFGLKWVAVLMFWSILFMFLGATYYAKRILEDFQYKFNLAKVSTGPWAVLLDPVNSVQAIVNNFRKFIKAAKQAKDGSNDGGVDVGVEADDGMQ